METVEEVPVIERPRAQPADQDCEDLKKIVVTPVYHGRLAESHLRTLNAWQGQPWYTRTYNRVQRTATEFVESNEATILYVLTYAIAILLFGMLIYVGVMIAFQLMSSKKRSSWSLGRSSPSQHAQVSAGQVAQVAQAQ